jgi:hypothetical protein
MAIALVIVGVPAIFAWNIYSASEARRTLHDSAITTGRTIVKTSIKRKVADGEVEFVLRQVDGRFVRVIADKDAMAAFVTETVLVLDKARQRAHERARISLDRVFDVTFATRQEDLDAYADWFFAWGRSWRLLYEALTGAAQEAMRLGFSQTQMTDAARHSVEAYLLRHYQDFVLKPGLRDPFIVEGVTQVLRDANNDYLASVADLDDRVQRFLSNEALLAEKIDTESVSIRIDWDAEKWRGPRSRVEDRYLEPLRTVALAGGSAVITGPLLKRIALPIFARTTVQTLASAKLAISGASLGSIKPGIGTAIGAIGGVVIDLGLNAFQEKVERDDFIEQNSAALEATIAAWKSTIFPEIMQGIDVWFDDAQALVMKPIAP